MPASRKMKEVPVSEEVVLQTVNGYLCNSGNMLTYAMVDSSIQ
jgi:hypothetical protein